MGQIFSMAMPMQALDLPIVGVLWITILAASAKWAVDHKIICWGCDQLGTDPFPFETEREALPMHLEMLTKAGIRLMENIYMEEIVKQKIYEFCLFAAPLKIKGGTASPIRLLALI